MHRRLLVHHEAYTLARWISRSRQGTLGPNPRMSDNCHDWGLRHSGPSCKQYHISCVRNRLSDRPIWSPTYGRWSNLSRGGLEERSIDAPVIEFCMLLRGSSPFSQSQAFRFCCEFGRHTDKSTTRGSAPHTRVADHPITHATSQSFSSMLDSRRKAISDSIRIIPDFPKKGIMFQDVTTLLLSPEAFQFCIDDFAERYKGQDIEAVVGELMPETLLQIAVSIFRHASQTVCCAGQGLKPGVSYLEPPWHSPCMCLSCR